MRNLSKTLAVVSLLAPASGYTLGIGDIKLHSALNQNLNAEISLVLSAGETAADIKVNLAPPDKFDAAGVPWASFLSKIKFATVVGANGLVLIKLSSYEAVKEPFLDFLLEVSWPKGSLYREFTVLVDPPGVYKQATIPVVTSSESYEPEQDVTLQPQTLQSQQTEIENNLGGASEYGPTRRNETLWKIAERINRQEDISVEQMTIALYEENPGAFYQDNMNALLSGKTLKIPDREVILKFSRKEALAVIKQQTKAWKNRLTQTPIETAGVKKDTIDNQLTLSAPAEAAISKNVEVAPENEQATAKKTAADELPASSEIANNEAVVTSPADHALQNKVAELEKQLAAMQQIIVLKDQQLAALQNQSQAKPIIQSQAIQPAPGQAEITTPAVQQKPAQPAVNPPVQPESEVIQPAPGQAEIIAPVVQQKPDQPVVNPPVQPESEAIQPAPDQAEITVPAVSQKPDQSVVNPPGQPESEAGDFLDPYYLWVGGIGTGTLSLFGWLWRRKRKIDEETDIQVPFAASNKSNLTASKEIFSPSLNKNGVAYDAAGASTGGESSFLSEITFADFDTFDTDQSEIDPISEADVYLAYGRYQQAEELMRDTLKGQPDRDECKLKLLEIFYSRKNRQAFEDYASELVEAGKKDDVKFWAKVTEMASEICPDSILFSSGVDQFSAEENTNFEKNHANITEQVESNSETLADINQADLGLTLFNDEDVNEVSETADSLLNFDLSSFEDDVLDDEGKNNESINFDLAALADSAEIDKGHEDAFWKTQEVTGKDEFESIDFVLSSNAVEAKEHGKIDLSGINDVNEGYQSIELSGNKESGLSDSISNDFHEGDFDFDMPIVGLNGQDAELVDMDELETKLDLAMAYIDMNDSVAAKDIAIEVLEKGSPEQQMTAKVLLDGLR